ncbi:MAG: hypothetical protein U0Q12_04325 [Vicinamibacterales bacterium]
MTNRFSATTRPALWTILSMGLLVSAAGCKREEPPPPPPEPVTADAPPEAPADVTALQQTEQQSLEQVARDIEEAERRETQASASLSAAVKKYRAQGGSLPTNLGGGELTEEQRALLVDQIEKEKASRRQLLQSILDRDKDIADLKAKVKKLSDQQGGDLVSVVAQEGQRHDRIAMDYLIKRGVNAEKAYGIVSQFALMDALLPGFRVWTYYQNGQFGTWVTKGNAGVTPAEHQKRLAALRDDELKASKAEIARLSEQLNMNAQELEAALKDAERAQQLEAEKNEQAERAEREAKQRSDLEETVSYIVGNKKQLEKAKVIDGKYRLQSLDLPNPTRLVLSEKASFSIDASVVELKKIKKITLAPQFTLGTDYQVSINEGFAADVTLINKDKFKRAKAFVVVVE